jgi:hypothetical protein
VGEKQWEGLKDKSKKKMMTNFEMAIKRCYAGDDQQFSVDLQEVEDDPAVGIEDETIVLRRCTTFRPRTGARIEIKSRAGKVCPL